MKFQLVSFNDYTDYNYFIILMKIIFYFNNAYTERILKTVCLCLSVQKNLPSVAGVQCSGYSSGRSGCSEVQHMNTH